MKTEKKAVRYTGISYLRIIATASVIWLHTAGTIITSGTQLDEHSKMFILSLQSIMSWAVPVFFMITGCLLLQPEKEITAVQCVRKYALRALLALFIFGIPFAMLILVFESRAINLQIVLKSITAVLTGDSFAHLWYLYTLIGIYLILPVLRSFVKNSSGKDMIIVTAALFVMNFIVPFISTITGLSLDFSIPFTYPIFYMLAGYYISAKKPRLLHNTKINILLLAVLTASTVISVYNDEIGDFLHNSVLTALKAILIFSCFTIPVWNGSGKHSDIIWKIDRLCFGAYLIHPLFIQFSYRFLEFTPMSFSTYYLAFIPFFTAFLILSFLGSALMRVIKPLKKYVL